jgi:outer membrane lipoprotein-sorting protein
MTQKRAARIAGCLVLAAVFAPPARAASLEEVVNCALGNLSPIAHRTGKFVTRASATSTERTIEWEYWALQQDAGLRKVVIARKGAANGEVAAYLFQDGDAVGETWQYVKGQPEAERVRLTGEEARLFGTNFSLEDYARTARVVFPGQVRQLPEATLDGRGVYVVETHPAPGSKSDYERLVTSIDKERCTVLRREAYDDQFEGGKRARKVYAVAPGGVAADGKFFTPVRSQLDDLKDGSETHIVVEKFDLPTSLDPEKFTPEALPRAGQ